MTSAPTSYLQTLANDEAIAFVTSLQSVKVHLSQELQWLRAQVQQKTVQLQGLETLLSEAAGLGLAAADTPSMAEDAAAAIATPIVTETIANHESGLALSTTDNGNTAPVEAIEPIVEAIEPIVDAIAAIPVKKPATPQRGSQGKADHAKAPRRSKTSPSTKTSAAKATQPKRSTSPANKTGGLQPFLQSPFRDKGLTESVSDILNRASTPLSTDDVMAELYDGLSSDDYDRAKHSVANILSVGRSKGTWKSTGRGRYAGNALATQ